MFMKTPIKRQADKKKGQGTLCKGQGVTEEGQGAIQRRQGAAPCYFATDETLTPTSMTSLIYWSFVTCSREN